MIFVFGSNLAGRHGKGAALFAREHRGAVYGVGVGRTGDAYALPTKDAEMKTLPLKVIKEYFSEFLDYVFLNPDLDFELTPFGTGLAGYKKKEIAELIKQFDLPSNVYLSHTWITS